MASGFKDPALIHLISEATISFLSRSVITLEDKNLVSKAKRKSKFSMALDGEFYRERNKGDFPLEEFECKVPSRIYGKQKLMNMTKQCTIFVFFTKSNILEILLCFLNFFRLEN